MAANTLTPAKIRRQWQNGDHDQRQQLIVDVALDVLHRKSIDAVTMRSLADRIGVGTMTLYTYVDGLDGLKRLMIHQGFEMMRDHCDTHAANEGPEKWFGGSRAYIQFAIDHCNLYKLMFDTPLDDDDPSNRQMLLGEFQPLFDRMSEKLAYLNLPEEEHRELSQKTAEQLWITLHGIASLAIAGRLAALNIDIEKLLDDCLRNVVPSE